MPAWSARCCLLTLVLLASSVPARAENQTAAREEFSQGKTAYLEGRYEDAIKHYERAMELKYSAKLHFNLGLAFEKLGQSAKALESYRRYLREEPGARNADEVRRLIEALERRPGPRRPEVQVAPRQGPSPGATPAYGVMPNLPPPSADEVTIDLDSVPRLAEVFINGKFLGLTPLRLNARSQELYTLSLEKRGYLSHREKLYLRERQQIVRPLQMTEEGRLEWMTRSEWIGINSGIGYAPSGSTALWVFHLEALTLKWRHFVWNLIDAGGGAGSDASTWFLGTRPGYPIYLGARGQHQLRIGVGLGPGGVTVNDKRSWTGNEYVSLKEGGTGFILSPGLDYRYLTRGRFCWGGSVRLFVSATGDKHPAAVFFTIPFAWTSRPI